MKFSSFLLHVFQIVSAVLAESVFSSYFYPENNQHFNRFNLFTGLEFSYEEAPASMKSVVTAFWQLTIAIGNVITVVFMSGTELFESKAYEFILFGSLMVVSMLVFMLLSYFYKGSTSKDKANAVQ